MTTENLTISQNSEYSAEFNFNDSDGVAIDLTGSKIVFKAHLNQTTEKIVKEITETSDIDTIGQITDPLNGKFQVKFLEEDTKDIFDGTYSLRWYVVDGETGNIIISGDPCEIAEFKICFAG